METFEEVLWFELFILSALLTATVVVLFAPWPFWLLFIFPLAGAGSIAAVMIDLHL
jgi:hypothetical protein